MYFAIFDKKPHSTNAKANLAYIAAYILKHTCHAIAFNHLPDLRWCDRPWAGTAKLLLPTSTATHFFFTTIKFTPVSAISAFFFASISAGFK